MVDIFLILVSITVLFFFLLAVKELFGKRLKEKFCVICTAVTLTWVSLLVLYYLGLFDNLIIIALLLGQSSLGVFYLTEKKVKSDLKIFRLPFLLTLIIFAYLLLVLPEKLPWIFGLLASVWLVFGFVYIFRRNENLKSFAKKMVECCRNW